MKNTTSKIEKNAPYNSKSAQRNKEIANIYQEKSDLKRLTEFTTKPTTDLTRKLKSKSHSNKVDSKKLNMYRSKQYLTQSEKLNMVNSKDLKDALDEDYGVFSEDIKKSLKDWLFRNLTNQKSKEDFITKIVQDTKKKEKMVEKKVEKIVGNLDYKIINDNNKIIEKLLAVNGFNPNQYKLGQFEDNILGLFGEVGSKIFLAKLADKRKKPISNNKSINILHNKPELLVCSSGSEFLNLHPLLESSNKSRN